MNKQNVRLWKQSLYNDGHQFQQYQQIYKKDVQTNKGAIVVVII